MKISTLSFLSVLLTTSTNLMAQVEFIAMEYYMGINNRTYAVFVTDSLVYGGKVNGTIAAGLSLKYPPQALADPYFYADKDKLEIYRNIKNPLLIKEVDNENFVYKRSDVEKITYTQKKKWGMGDVKHTGRVFFHIKDKGKREFILLGSINPEIFKESLGIE